MHCMEQFEGPAPVRRAIGSMGMRHFTPFLMLDHYNIPPGAVGPDHPHRGQEVVTLVFKNTMVHEDFTGSQGVLNAGDLQFMTAGRGICHNEMPYSHDGGNIEGMQLWVDLPAELKDSEPRYRDLKAKDVPIVKPDDKVTVKVISGEAYGVESLKELAYTPMVFYHYTVKPGGKFYQALPSEFNSFLYILNGTVNINSRDIPEFHITFFNRDGGAIEGYVPEDASETQFIILGGKPLDQPIVQHGPFVETSKERIYKALTDYQYGANGFERAKGWVSEVSGGITPQLYNRILSQSSHEKKVKDEL